MLVPRPYKHAASDKHRHLDAAEMQADTCDLSCDAPTGAEVPGSLCAVLPRGINLPWLRYGGDFGANAWSPRGGLSRRDTTDLHRALADAADAGAEVVRWFVLCDGRAGIAYDDAGRPRALHPVVFDDMHGALDALHAHGLRMVPVLFDFTWARPARRVNGVTLGGRAHVLADPVARHGLWRVADDLVGAFGRHPGIAMWDLWNEPEWMVTPWSLRGRLTGARVRQALGELCLHVRWHATQPITVGLASVLGVPLCRGIGLDVVQVHWYDHVERRAPLARVPVVPWLDTPPLLLGEFPTRGSGREPAHIHTTACDAGYAAAWPWSLLADDASTAREAALDALRHARDRRPRA